MISLENIRNRSGLLLTVIGVAMLAFIMTDLLSSQGGGTPTDLVVGEINGQPVDYKDFEQRVQQNVENQKQSNPNINVSQVRNSTWSQTLREYIYQEQYEKLALSVGSDELFDMIQGDNPHPSILQSFSDPQTGEFSRARLLQYLKEDIDNDETGQSRLMWLRFEEAIMNERKTNKYNALAQKGFSVSNWEASLNFQHQSEVRNVSFVSVPFASVADSLVSVTDSELISYMKENKDLYQQDASRSIEYVVFNVRPTSDDREAANDWITDIVSDFKNAEDDALFVRKYSDNPTLVKFYAYEELLSPEDELVNAKLGTVIGPYNEGSNNLRLAKLVDVQNIPDSVSARHILISTPDAVSKIDSIKNLIENGASFGELAKNNSEDQVSALNDGDLGWFTEGTMVAPFNDACFTGSIGVLQTVTTQFGVHLIEVTKRSKTTKKYKIAYLDRNVLPSNQTYQAIFTKAGKFAAENTSVEMFDEAAETENLSKRIAENLQPSTSTISGLENPRELVRWANDASVGDVSDVFEFSDKFVVASLVSVKKEGLQDLEDARAQVESLVRAKKKSDYLIDQIGEVTSLNEMATQFTATIKQATGLTFNNNQVSTLGNEPSFVGASFSVEEGQTTKPFVGKSAVYMLKVDKVLTAPSKEDFSSERQALMSQYKSRMNFQIYQALEELSEIKDNRAKFY